MNTSRFIRAVAFASCVSSTAAIVAACSADEGSDPREDFDSGKYTVGDSSLPGYDGGPPNEAGVVGPTCTGTCVVQLAVGGSFACALFSDGKISCWGSNLSGQLGVTGVDSSSTPIQLRGLVPIKTISAGGWHSCALTTDERIFCWGINSSAEVGATADTKPHFDPNEVKGFPIGAKPVDVQSGSFHSCALLTGDRVACWGYNAQGQLGTGTASGQTVSPTNSAKPSAISSLTGATSITLGGQTTCATMPSGIECLGSNIFGQLGRGSATPLVDVRSAALGSVIVGVDSFLSAQGRNFAVTRQDGRVVLWGSNGYGESGIGDAATDIYGPTLYPGLENIASATAGNDMTCVVTKERSVKCWGRNTSGQVGQPSGGTITKPTLVPNLTNVYRVALSTLSFGCALTYDGEVYCWGANESGQLGDGTTTSSSTPVKVKF